ncbi:MAG: amidase [Natronospirillum sp.]|uniref:amidase n=1 Tax=Natronospirillum sp. TaxID=2812955 RepID=UPI0025EBECCF|nr:amidase [Natronospirillum sp.]MCH8551908.1 amidase [Natronospirillum sp.]
MTPRRMPSVSKNTIHHSSLRSLARSLREGSVRAVDIAESCKTAYNTHETRLGAYKTWNGEGMLDTARLADSLLSSGWDLGPMQGLPFSAKDLFGVPQLPTFAGSPAALPAQWQTPGPLVQTLLTQMAPVSGKTHTVEFAYGGLGTNRHWTPPRNPWDAQAVRVPGGSSSGAGVSLIQGSALLALGTDTAGSVRVPASMTGTVGLKTTKHLWSTDGIVPLSDSFDTPGLFTRTVADAVFAFEALQGSAVPELHSLAGVRIGVPEQFFWEDCEPGITEAVQQGLKELERAGATLVTLDIEHVAEAYDHFQKGGVSPPELYRFLQRDLPDWLETMDPNVRTRMETGKDITAWEYLQRLDRFRAIGALAAQQLETVDVLATPSVAVTPPTLEALEPEGEYARINIKALRNTCIGNVLGLCGLTLPVGLDQASMPVGLLLTARPYSEARMLGVAAQMECVLGTVIERLGTAPRLKA